MESQAYLAGVSRDEAQSAAPYQEAIDQTHTAVGCTEPAKPDLGAGLHERQFVPRAAFQDTQHPG